jgi:hypothetical protein
LKINVKLKFRISLPISGLAVIRTLVTSHEAILYQYRTL